MNTIVFNKLSSQVLFEEKAKEVEMSSRNYLEVIDGQHPDLLCSSPAIRDSQAVRHRRSGGRPSGSKVRHKRQALQDMARPLKQWLYKHRDNPYPTKTEKILLALGSQMTLVQPWSGQPRLHVPGSSWPAFIADECSVLLGMSLFSYRALILPRLHLALDSHSLLQGLLEDLPVANGIYPEVGLMSPVSGQVRMTVIHGQVKAQAMSQEIDTLQAKGAILPVDPFGIQGAFIKVFLAPKKTGGLHPILDLRAFYPLQAKGLKILPYLEDWLICAPTETEAAAGTCTLLNHVDLLSLPVNWQKSNLILSQQFSRQPDLSWALRIKLYNKYVQGNAERLSVSSDDSCSEDGDNPQRTQNGPEFLPKPLYQSVIKKEGSSMVGVAIGMDPGLRSAVDDASLPVVSSNGGVAASQEEKVKAKDETQWKEINAAVALTNLAQGTDGVSGTTSCIIQKSSHIVEVKTVKKAAAAAELLALTFSVFAKQQTFLSEPTEAK
ncbi:PREDICTED: homeobox protein Mohawk [Cyprinodon variegatus]|uniref:homeobox protein Mohawk n=1 Tax=Cyprinodon variegatus TaxID=28743 RepID=UPI0007428153|nr:PREDICTED: homeobox protein Mohawk [Cyprinodon variegatus]